MKIRNTTARALTVAFCALLLVSAEGCKRKRPIFSLSPTNMLFSGAQDDVPPPDQTLTMTGIHAIPLEGATWGLVTDQPWLTVTPTSGMIHASEGLVLTVHADQAFLPQGLYSGEITLVAHFGKHTYPATYQVTLDVTAGNSPPPIVIPAPEEAEEVEVEVAAGLPDEDESFRKELPARICFSGSRR